MSAARARATTVRIVVGRSPDVPEKGTLDALEKLGPEVRLHEAPDAAAALRCAREKRADLVILEEAGAAGDGGPLDLLRASGPPVIVVTDGDPGRSLEAFRCGAADCVSRGADYAEILPVVALEHIRRWRAARARGAAARRIRRLEALNDAIVRQMPAALAVLDASLRVVGVNPAFARAFGVSAEAVAGRALAEVLPRPLLSSGGVQELLEHAAAGRSPAPRLARLPRAGSEPRAFDVRAQRLDEAGRLLLLLSEVTERETLARRVENLRRTNEHIIQNMNSALIVVDPEGRISLCNPAAESILGADPGDLTGRSVWAGFPGTPRERVLLWRTLHEGARYRGAEAVVVRLDGRRVPIGVSSAPLHDADGRRIGAVAIFQDLSEIKQLQQQLLQSEKMAAVGQLAAGVAHEINNPTGFIHANLIQMVEYLRDLERLREPLEALAARLEAGDAAAIRAAAEALAGTAGEVDAPFLLRDLATAVGESLEGAERIRHIVRDLREFSHQGGDARELADVNQCLDSTAHIAWRMMKNGVRLERDYGELPPLACHPMQLKQVFMNLLVNACQAVQERSSEGDRGAVRLRTRARGDAIVVTVADDGAGIRPEHRDHIFEPFFTTKEVGVGTGLGLSTAFQIVERHGGSIRVESEPGRGAVFEVVLPLRGPADDEPSADR